MSKTLRSLVLVGGLVLGMGAGIAPASAATGAGAFVGNATISCFGCGASGGSASLNVTGTVGGTTVVNGAATASFSLNEPSTTCPATGTANGSVSGAVNVTFTWTRVGAVAVITTAGDINGTGVAAFAVTSPGLVCGMSNVTAAFAGALAGL